MGEPIVNRNDYQYSSDMETIMMDVDTSIFPVRWLHGDDDTPCEHPHECEALGRFPYVRGGRPGFGTFTE